jgi:hypothetical protein
MRFARIEYGGQKKAVGRFRGGRRSRPIPYLIPYLRRFVPLFNGLMRSERPGVAGQQVVPRPCPTTHAKKCKTMPECASVCIRACNDIKWPDGGCFNQSNGWRAPMGRHPIAQLRIRDLTKRILLFIICIPAARTQDRRTTRPPP